MLTIMIKGIKVQNLLDINEEPQIQSYVKEMQNQISQCLELVENMQNITPQLTSNYS